MRKLAFLLMVSMMVVVIGCKKTETTSKPKSTPSKSSKVEVGAVDDVTITQGGDTTLKVTITRTELKEPVDIVLKGLPDGVSAEKKTIAKDSSEATVELKAKGDAKVSKGKATVVATAPGDISSEKEFKIEVKKAAKGE